MAHKDAPALSRTECKESEETEKASDDRFPQHTELYIRRAPTDGVLIADKPGRL